MKALLEKFGIVGDVTEALVGYGSENYKIKTSNNTYFVLKKHKLEKLGIVTEELALIASLSKNLSVEFPEAVDFDGTKIVQDGDQTIARLSSFIHGDFLSEVKHSSGLCYNFGETVALIHHAIESHSNSALDFPHIKSKSSIWNLLNAADCKTDCITDYTLRKCIEYFLLEFEREALPILKTLPKFIIHNDLNDWNVLTKDQKVSGIIDFGDACYAPLINDIAIALCYLMFDKENPLICASQFLEGYLSQRNLSIQEIELLYYLIPARLCTSICQSSSYIKESESSDYILISQEDACELLKKWLRFNPLAFKNLLNNRNNDTDTVDKNGIDEQVLRRKNVSSEILSLSYEEPIYLDRAVFQYMFDKSGNTFLDAYNNIPHIGHSHPQISLAIEKQSRHLNTNTRYLYESYTKYSELLLSLFHEKLSKVLFVNSGSAASDLAIRLARQYTGQSHQLVLDNGYHGNTSLGIDISAYKFDGKGGKGKPSHVTKLPLPKEYNGTCSSAAEYVSQAKDIINKLIDSGLRPSSLIVECISGCGGQVPLATGYLKMLKPFLERNDILLIADEVQTGFGRMGDCFWSYELHDVIPDIVVLGKPMGNGHPIGGIITSTEIAERFVNGMEFFSSFGGNPVSCEVGKTVLTVIENEGLQHNAKIVGDYYKAQLNTLKNTYPVIGDVRGQGLFLGVEFINPHTMEADGDIAEYVKNNLRNNYVLVGTDGPFNNVIKSKPPLCFSKDNVDEVIHKMANILKSYST